MAKKEEEKIETLEKGSPEWREAKRKGKEALDERLGTARKVVVRQDRR